MIEDARVGTVLGDHHSSVGIMLVAHDNRVDTMLVDHHGRPVIEFPY